MKKQSKTRFVGAKIPEDLYKQLLALAKREHRSVSGQMTVFLCRGVEHLELELAGNADVKSA